MRLAVLCALCGSWRWCGRPCVNRPAMLTAPPPVNRQPVNKPAKRKPARKAKPKPAAKPKDGRAIYMREYMRKKRQAKP